MEQEPKEVPALDLSPPHIHPLMEFGQDQGVEQDFQEDHKEPQEDLYLCPPGRGVSWVTGIQPPVY